MSAKSKEEFPPYATYFINSESIDRFTRLTDMSYGLMWDLVRGSKQSQDMPIAVSREMIEAGSFSTADSEVQTVEEVYRWVNAEEYSAKQGIPVGDVLNLIERGELGPIAKHSDTGKPMIIWPPEHQSDSAAADLPVGEKSFRVEVQTKISVSAEFDVDDPDFQKKVVQIARRIGSNEKAYSEARKTLYQSSILLQWTAFETFARDTVAKTLRDNPEKLSSVRKEIPYGDLVELSAGLTSLTSLTESLIEREIDSLRSGGMSVHGLINYLKKEYRFHSDPYVAKFYYKGSRRSASYADLNRIKDMRNSLTHEGKAVNWIDNDPEFSGAYSLGYLVMKTIAHQLAESIRLNRFSA